MTMNPKMISILPESRPNRDAYRLLISTVIPRPIAWVSSMGADGSLNLAPFSFFNVVNGTPPVIMISVDSRRGRKKDTLRNIEETGEFVVNMVDLELAEAMNQSSGEWDYDVNEFEVARLATAASVDVRPPRVAAAKAAMEARLTRIIPLDVEGGSSTMILGQVVRLHLREDIMRPDGLVDASLLQPVARLGGPEYASLGEVFSMERPVVNG
jgi:flavin reductase (DIM6/NTAB) family NADH-FMN oxidoreductase RutF